MNAGRAGRLVKQSDCQLCPNHRETEHNREHDRSSGERAPGVSDAEHHSRPRPEEQHGSHYKVPRPHETSSVNCIAAAGTSRSNAVAGVTPSIGRPMDAGVIDGSFMGINARRYA